ncbi:hypothetical protein Rt10032_c19g6166 [Rhodotorula toruloides]|uniref:Uncharacterized protein n=1 Tax=Rhodotorula toruloides TaxID=5286 RepID=A0A511KP52_RHOTO|nr:hypothetical protein Rt10032_c19g6166 [Rhodotorula toruloides]
MSSYDNDPQRLDSESVTQKDPVGASHGTVDNLNDQYFRNPPNNLGLDNPVEQDRASDLVGAQNTEPIADPPSKEELKRVQELADRLNK